MIRGAVGKIAPFFVAWKNIDTALHIKKLSKIKLEY
jgi:hypothetical protein